MNISDVLFRSLGTHAVKRISISEGQLILVVAPWDDLANEATATFSNVQIRYIEADNGIKGIPADLDLPWDIIRFDSNPSEAARWEFGLCCTDIQLGFISDSPDIQFIEASA